MSVAIVTGSGGLVGSTAVKFLLGKGVCVIGVDNDMRGSLFGEDASVAGVIAELRSYSGYTHLDMDLRRGGTYVFLDDYGADVELIIHAAGQPSHDWSTQTPMVDFDLNARATLLMLEFARLRCPNATFAFLSTNKVYGDRVNTWPFREYTSRYDIPTPPFCSMNPRHRHKGVSEAMSIDRSLRSLFGVSKTAADLMVQEYGEYFGMKTVCFRCGCITGSAQQGVKLHGFLAYLAKCIKEDILYTILGYKGKQVRDNLHAWDLVNAIWHFHRSYKRSTAYVYNMGGGRDHSCSILEAIKTMEWLSGKTLKVEYASTPRKGDHKWWISNVGLFQRAHTQWHLEYSMDRIYKELLNV